MDSTEGDDLVDSMEDGGICVFRTKIFFRISVINMANSIRTPRCVGMP
jgi:hypothetical protein